MQSSSDNSFSAVHILATWIPVLVVLVILPLLLSRFSAISALSVALALVAGLLWYLHVRGSFAAFLCVGCFLLIPLVVVMLWTAGLLFARHQWEKVNPVLHPGINRAQVDETLAGYRTIAREDFREMYASQFFFGKGHSRSQTECPVGFHPVADDSYVTYKLLGLFDIDAVFSPDGETRLLFPSFDY